MVNIHQKAIYVKFDSLNIVNIHKKTHYVKFDSLNIANIHQKNSKILRIPNLCMYLFFCRVSGYRVIRNFVIFHKIKVSKHIWD
jgi:hypothetical protein